MLYGERVKKSAEVVSALGTTDELSSNIGVAMEYCRQYAELSELVSRLAAIQCRLQELNSTVASRGGRPFDAEGNHIKTIEGWIDEMDSHLVPLRAFILPVTFWKIFHNNVVWGFAKCSLTCCQVSVSAG